MVVSLLIFSFILNRKKLFLQYIDLAWLFIIMTSLLSFNINDNIINFFFILIVLIVSKDISVDDFYKKSFYITFICSLVIILFLQIGLTQNIQYYQMGRARNTFGFNNVNAFSNLVYSFSMLFLLTRKVIKWSHLLLISGFMYIMFTFTNTRTSILVFSLFLIIFIILNVIFKLENSQKYKVIMKIFMFILILLPLILSLLSPIIFTGFPFLNAITSLRLSIFTNYITDNGLLHLIFGGTKLDNVDNGLLILVYSMGLIFTLFVLYMILHAMSKLIDMRDSKNIAFLISFMYFNIFESILVRPEISVSICFWFLIYKSIEKSKKEIV